jgi:hypothetical protein
MNDTPNMGDTVTLPDYTEKFMVKSVSDDGRSVDLMTLTKRPVLLKDVASHKLTMVKPASNT